MLLQHSELINATSILDQKMAFAFQNVAAPAATAAPAVVVVMVVINKRAVDSGTTSGNGKMKSAVVQCGHTWIVPFQNSF